MVHDFEILIGVHQSMNSVLLIQLDGIDIGGLKYISAPALLCQYNQTRTNYIHANYTWFFSPFGIFLYVLCTAFICYYQFAVLTTVQMMMGSEN